MNTAALILHDIGTKDDRKELVEAFNKEEIDILFVYNMLLTVDAPRLKKLYIGRVIKAHNFYRRLQELIELIKHLVMDMLLILQILKKSLKKQMRIISRNCNLS